MKTANSNFVIHAIVYAIVEGNLEKRGEVIRGVSDYATTFAIYEKIGRAMLDHRPEPELVRRALAQGRG